MSNLADYNSKLELIKAIADEDTLSPNQPVDVFLQESENLYHWSLDDAPKLKTVGITKKMLDDIPVRTGACREAQSIWNKDYRSQKEAQKQWRIQSPPAYELRDELLHSMRYAYRNEPALLSRIAAVSKGDGHANMIQDLNDLAVIGKENPEPLTAVGFKITKLDTAATTADKMATLLAEANGNKAEQNESKVIRDKAFTHLKELVDEVREAGKFLFWKDKTRYKGYTSSYWKRKKKTKDEADEVAA